MSWLDRLAQAVQRGEVFAARYRSQGPRPHGRERGPEINAICADNSGLEHEADAVAAQLDAGAHLPRAGVPVLTKDNIWVEELRVPLRAALDRHGVIDTPTIPCATWEADQLVPANIRGHPSAPCDHAAFKPPANHAGIPAMSIPCDHDGARRLLWLQLISKARRDGALMGLEQAVEPILERIDRCEFY